MLVTTCGGVGRLFHAEKRRPTLEVVSSKIHLVGWWVGTSASTACEGIPLSRSGGAADDMPWGRREFGFAPSLIVEVHHLARSSLVPNGRHAVAVGCPLNIRPPCLGDSATLLAPTS